MSLYLSVSQFKTAHAHLITSRPDITDDQIQIEIDAAEEEFEFGCGSINITMRLIGFLVCHRLQQIPDPQECGGYAGLVGRLVEIGTDIEKFKSNAGTLKNPYDYLTTACGAQFQKWIDTGSIGVLGVGVHVRDEMPDAGYY
jgi:hypothetical protein